MSINLDNWRQRHASKQSGFAEHLAWVEKRLNRCESDLERLFLIIFAYQTMAARIFTYGGKEPLSGPVCTARRFDLSQQVRIAGYRCDFVITIEFPKLGRRRRIAIECDGHSFHDRTQEQASYDRRRDRKLLAVGVPTIRFTYSDITSDPAGVMSELRETVLALADELMGKEARK